MKDHRNEFDLTPAELDAALETPEQARIADVVSMLERLEPGRDFAMGVLARVRQRARVRFATGFGAAAAACLALIAVLVQQPETSDKPVTSETASLYDWHNEAVATSVLPGDGANLSAFSQIAASTENQ
jgi:hypothetical protein